MAKYYNVLDPSDFYCTKCGNKNLITISRKNGQAREPGHLKKLYCFNCKEEVNHAEVRPMIMTYTYEDFKREFESGRFVNGKRVEINDLKYCSNTSCKFNKNGKCWNANNSANCKHKPQ